MNFSIPEDTKRLMEILKEGDIIEFNGDVTAGFYYYRNSKHVVVTDVWTGLSKGWYVVTRWNNGQWETPIWNNGKWDPEAWTMRIEHIVKYEGKVVSKLTALVLGGKSDE